MMLWSQADTVFQGRLVQAAGLGLDADEVQVLFARYATRPTGAMYTVNSSFPSTPIN